mgnify:CR=1 FL=1
MGPPDKPGDDAHGGGSGCPKHRRAAHLGHGQGRRGLRAVRGRSAQVEDALEGLDLLFYGADSAAELARIGALVPALADKGALWVVSRKGKAARVRDVEVMAAARGFGLVDSKVVGFSDTLTALRFTRRRT